MDWIEYLQFVINSIKNPQQSYMMPNSSAIENGLDTLMSTNSILDLLRMNSVNNSFGIEQQQQVCVKFSITFYLRFYKNVFLLGTVESTLQLEPAAHKSIGAA